MERKWFPAVVVCLIAGAIPATVAGDNARFSGSYVWDRPDQKTEGELDVVFTPTGEGAWNVVFRFDWEGEAREFAGTATGDLDGELKGNVDSDDPSHPLEFEFTGVFSDGKFNGTHGYFNRRGELVESGTLELVPAG